MTVKRLECPYNAEEFGESAGIHFREVVFLEFTEVAVVTDYICSSGDDGTVDELVIVGIGLDEVESVGGVDVLHVGRCMVFFRAGSTIRRASAA